MLYKGQWLILGAVKGQGPSPSDESKGQSVGRQQQPHTFHVPQIRTLHGAAAVAESRAARGRVAQHQRVATTKDYQSESKEKQGMGIFRGGTKVLAEARGHRHRRCCCCTRSSVRVGTAVIVAGATEPPTHPPTRARRNLRATNCQRPTVKRVHRSRPPTAEAENETMVWPCILPHASDNRL